MVLTVAPAVFTSRIMADKVVNNVRDKIQIADATSNLHDPKRDIDCQLPSSTPHLEAQGTVATQRRMPLRDPDVLHHREYVQTHAAGEQDNSAKNPSLHEHIRER